MPRTDSGVSGSVQYDLDISCYNDHEGERMFATDETSDKGNTIVECGKCGNRRAVKVHVAPLGGSD